VGERVNLVPEVAPRLRVDAGGRLVEEKKLVWGVWCQALNVDAVSFSISQFCS
jgi:hypothetical protein